MIFPEPKISAPQISNIKTIASFLIDYLLSRARNLVLSVKPKDIRDFIELLESFELLLVSLCNVEN